jgi:ferredoxin
MNNLADTAFLAAEAAAAALQPPQPETVTFTPGDCVLLVGPGEILLKRLDALKLTGLRASLLSTDATEMPRGLRALSGQLADISGWMGRFTARMATPQGGVDLSPLSHHEDGHFDWVLDFSATPGAVAEVPPLGYYALAVDDFPALKHSLLEIAARVRSGHDKSRYFAYDAQRCAHRRQEVAGCSVCLSACSAGAISGDKEAIRIEPYLCQGCGSCTLVCPSGAVRYDHPGPGYSLTRLRAMLHAWDAAGGGPVGLWIVNAAIPTEAPIGWLPYPVAEPASLGLEIWLAALAMGCNRVAITPGELPAASRRALDAQLSLGRALLLGLNLPASLGLAANATEMAALPRLPDRIKADWVIADDKRILLFAAIDALVDLADAPPSQIALPAAPIGEIRIATEKCTLCAACVRICPTGAISLPGTTTQLAFTEQRCLQCGLCANVCPEQAVSLVPRLLTAKTARQTPRVIAEAEPYGCVECGKQFTTRAMIERSRAMMAGHPMFQGEQARLMTLCPDCRQRAMAGVV